MDLYLALGFVILLFSVIGFLISAVETADTHGSVARKAAARRTLKIGAYGSSTALLWPIALPCLLGYGIYRLALFLYREATA